MKAGRSRSRSRSRDDSKGKLQITVEAKLKKGSAQGIERPVPGPTEYVEKIVYRDPPKVETEAMETQTRNET